VYGFGTSAWTALLVLDRASALLHNAKLCAPVYALALLLCADTCMTGPSIAVHTNSMYPSLPSNNKFCTEQGD